MTRGAIESQETAGTLVIRPTAGIDRSHVRQVWTEAKRLLEERPPTRLVLDLRDVARIDGAGVALVRELEDQCQRRGLEFAAQGAAPAVAAYLEFVRRRSTEPTRVTPSGRPATITLLGDKAAAGARTLRELIELVGRFAESAAFFATHPHKIRAGDILYQVQRAGADGMWLLVALSLLLGVIMAFQGLSGMRGFGSPIVVADIVTISTTHEMAPLLTGVLMAGRSGASIAAEIGTMKIDQELDALTAMGFDVMRFLLVPRIVGLLVAVPLLTLLSMAAGVVGGASIGVFVLHLTPGSFFDEVRRTLSGTQIVSALAKGGAFGLAIGVVACFQGMQARQAAEDVGKQATAAVVRSILLIILTDAVFSVASEVYGWW